MGIRGLVCGCVATENPGMCFRFLDGVLRLDTYVSKRLLLDRKTELTEKVNRRTVKGSLVDM